MQWEKLVHGEEIIFFSLSDERWREMVSDSGSMYLYYNDCFVDVANSGRNDINRHVKIDFNFHMSLYYSSVSLIL